MRLSSRNTQNLISFSSFFTLIHSHRVAAEIRNARGRRDNDRVRIHTFKNLAIYIYKDVFNIRRNSHLGIAVIHRHHLVRLDQSNSTIKLSISSSVAIYLDWIIQICSCQLQSFSRFLYLKRSNYMFTLWKEKKGRGKAQKFASRKNRLNELSAQREDPQKTSYGTHIFYSLYKIPV